MRVNRFLARSGVASRRHAEAFVRAGRVRVNGTILTDLSTQIAEGDVVEVDGKRVDLPQMPAVLRYHKPRGVLCSHADPHGTHFIYDDLPAIPGLFSIGRLDQDSEGLLLVTNDGAYAQRVAHPSFETEKEYYVLLDRPLEHDDARALIRGVKRNGVVYRADAIRPHVPRSEEQAILPDWPRADDGAPLYSVLLHEGKKREIRHLFAAKDYTVKRLVRIRIDAVMLWGLAPGAYARLEGRQT